MKQNLNSIALALIVGLLAVLAVGCPKQQPAQDAPVLSDSSAPADATDSATPADAGATVDAAAIEEQYNKNCSLCHGDKLEGRPGMAPAITGMTAHWSSAEELAKYLHDPQGYADQDERLKANRDKYSMRMPAIPTMTDAERLAMAEWVLKQ